MDNMTMLEATMWQMSLQQPDTTSEAELKKKAESSIKRWNDQRKKLNLKEWT
ncbi:hypothetical protein HG263_05415 [Pseudoalteromonas sp. JBTF-M23]|uniref:Uncharacterized protein n=1 Tax=Pseudoalteromonas caenipelagi TaxID=2726988 RepID=A0A849VDG5_9GAMM|nr:hypothetical protein [Pseudoalteromonas caenipelagi]NOU49974.1 hypothetical protein [Pseudoalteromonas caenipelagi]